MRKEFIGLNNEEIIKSKEKYGTNVFEKEKTKGFFRRFLENLNDPIIKILIVALVIEVVFTFGKCNFFEVGGIILAILIATVVSTVSEFGSERAFERMQTENNLGKVRALRNGNVVEISAPEVVVGDIIYLSAGERVPADAILLSGKISVDQSALNGESREASKMPWNKDGDWSLTNKGRVFGGTVVTSGDAVVKVGRVGTGTYYGMVARDVQSETRESPLKLRLSKLASHISKIGYIAAAVVAFFYIFNAIILDNGFSWPRIVEALRDPKELFSVLIHALTLMITVIVVAVPEGLPMMITVVLSANMKKMVSDSVLVKKLVGIETAGSLNILFTDKTGTVTVGEPRCERIITVDATYKSISALRGADKIHLLLSLSAEYNSESCYSDGKIVGGNGTDKAITDYFKNEKKEKRKVKFKDAFSSEKKMSSVTFADGMTLIKGAPEIIISSCKFAIDSQGNIAPCDKRDVESKLKEVAGSGNRVVGVAFRSSDREGYIFVALIVLRDMLRRDTKDAITNMKRAGVQVVMLTGDNKDTAAAIAKECGILRDSERELVITSAELSKMSDEEIKRILPNLRVLARALPQDKTRLVRLSQECDLVVGMTGDGINDAPSLKLADVGFAMGSGADIAKNAGDIVILNNSMYAINRTILYGRTIFKSIRKFIRFQLVMNIAACGISLVGQLLGIETPITIIQMLWVNIIMDTLGGLAFAGEPALEYYMKEKPKRRDEPILDKKTVRDILLNGAYTLALCVAFLKMDVFKEIFWGRDSNIRFLTAFYALFVFLGIFNCFCARCERMWFLSNIRKNKLFLIIMLFISFIQILMIYYGGELFRSSPLSYKELLSVILLSFSIIPFDMCRRIFLKLINK